jgi:hypothetical protein
VFGKSMGRNSGSDEHTNQPLAVIGIVLLHGQTASVMAVWGRGRGRKVRQCHGFVSLVCFHVR